LPLFNDIAKGGSIFSLFRLNFGKSHVKIGFNPEFPFWPEILIEEDILLFKFELFKDI
jgi:hypothetical protein